MRLLPGGSQMVNGFNSGAEYFYQTRKLAELPGEQLPSPAAYPRAQSSTHRRSSVVGIAASPKKRASRQ